MILESLLEKSGLRKDEQYFMEHQLLDAEGKPLRSESEDKKMRPDALIKYPDDRNVIVDSKVSLTAFSRAIDASDDDQYAKELTLHLASVKGHIDALSAKGYEDYDKTLDFVLMFVPSEPAYIAAMQADPNLWNYAYEKRILLQSPTNLITSLKLIHELWKREAHNQNAQAIAERGRKLYDKFVGFVDKLDGVDKALSSAQEKFRSAYDHMSIGPGNLIRQADELKKMVVGTKKELSDGLVVMADPLEEGDAEVEQ
jgi:DNA recombination protein RmuC